MEGIDWVIRFVQRGLNFRWLGNEASRRTMKHTLLDKTWFNFERTCFLLPSLSIQLCLTWKNARNSHVKDTWGVMWMKRTEARVGNDYRKYRTQINQTWCVSVSLCAVSSICRSGMCVCESDCKASVHNRALSRSTQLVRCTYLHDCSHNWRVRNASNSLLSDDSPTHILYLFFNAYY